MMHKAGDYRIVVHAIDDQGGYQEWQACAEQYDGEMWVVLAKRTGNTHDGAIARADEWLSNRRTSEFARQAAVDRIEATREELPR
jgi:hypothetical protein